MIHGTDNGMAYKNIFEERKITFTLLKNILLPVDAPQTGMNR
jgi:hypothetical protein